MTFEKLYFIKYVIEAWVSHVTAVGNRGCKQHQAHSAPSGVDMNTREQSNAIKKAIAEVDLDLIGEASEIDDVFSLIFQSGEKKIPDWFHLLWSGSSVRKPSGDGTQQGSKTMQEKETKSIEI